MSSERTRTKRRAIIDWCRGVVQNLLCGMKWADFLAGLGLTSLISLLLVGFAYQSLPDYKVHSIAARDIRALRDISFEDVAATEQMREAARASVPELYELTTDHISARESAISKAFAKARDLLAVKQKASARSHATDREAILRDLKAAVGDTLPPAILPLFLRERFSPILEGQVLQVLDAVLRNGIILDRARFVADQHDGIVVRDSLSSFERPLTDAYIPRDVTAAREYLRQFHLEFSGLSGSDRAELIAFLETLLVPTLVENREETMRRRELAAARVVPAQIRVQQGTVIVHSGETITPHILAQLEALKKLQRPRSLLWQCIGFFSIAAMLTYALGRYFVYYQNRHSKIRNHMILILCVILCVLTVMRLMTSSADIFKERLGDLEGFHEVSDLYYAIPFALGSVLVTLLVDINLGIFVSIFIAIVSGLFYGDIYIASYALIGSLAGIYSIRQYKDRAAILKAGLTIGVFNCFGVFAVEILRMTPEVFAFTFSKLSLALISGMLASALVSMLLPVFEALFKITTDIRLLELANLDSPLLRRLAVEAPGTYHHSLMVGTLSEPAAEAIGANPLLVRVGAYYHDIGKMRKSAYFVENQGMGGNIHEPLTPDLSCLIIAGHVKDGLELAREAGLAERVRDMIPQHHGTRIMTFFYEKAKAAADRDGQAIIESDFRYPGPKPQSKEAAIIMMADAVEAASRSLRSPSPSQIREVISRLVGEIVDDDQLDECDITLHDVRLVQESFFKILTGIYHHRIDYPGYDFTEKGGESEGPPSERADPRPAKAL